MYALPSSYWKCEIKNLIRKSSNKNLNGNDCNKKLEKKKFHKKFYADKMN